MCSRKVDKGWVVQTNSAKTWYVCVVWVIRIWDGPIMFFSKWFVISNFAVRALPSAALCLDGDVLNHSRVSTESSSSPSSLSLSIATKSWSGQVEPFSEKSIGAIVQHRFSRPELTKTYKKNTPSFDSNHQVLGMFVYLLRQPFKIGGSWYCDAGVGMSVLSWFTTR